MSKASLLTVMEGGMTTKSTWGNIFTPQAKLPNCMEVFMHSRTLLMKNWSSKQKSEKSKEEVKHSRHIGFSCSLGRNVVINDRHENGVK